MAKVIGVGGVFFKAKDPAALMHWYRDVLGLDVHDWGGAFLLPDAMAAHPGAGTVFSPFKRDTTYFEPSTKDFMINLAVDDLAGVLERCAAHGVEAKVMPDEPNGRFAHISDPEGTRIELWEPKPMQGGRDRRLPELDFLADRSRDALVPVRGGGPARRQVSQRGRGRPRSAPP